jgi:predicted nucleotide-binding protein
MRNERRYIDTFFSAEVLAAAVARLEGVDAKKYDSWLLSTSSGDEKWRHDNVEEFFADYRKRPQSATMFRGVRRGLGLTVNVYDTDTVIEVEAVDRVKIETVFSICEAAREASKLPAKPSPKPVIFVGHGHSPLWRDLKEHLHDQHGYQVEAYETGARSGHVIRDILVELVRSSSFAFLVLTAEDEHADGTMHARENVIHETGLFQGRLKHGRAVVLLEEGATEFSNIAGIQQIRCMKNNIRETFGDVLAVLRRETLRS